MTTEHLDVLIIGAGLSGIGAAYHLQTQCPQKSYAILESRDAIGGTWDLFRYPGIRSDSDMFTLGYSFRPWKDARAIADGPAILNYIRETAAEYGIDRQIRFGHKLRRARWSSPDARWTLEVERAADGAIVQMTCNFLYMCSGYYDFENGYTPEWPGVERFQGGIVHPQKWTDSIDYAGKRVIIIGSGATAVTLAPELAKKAAHVIMLQRSPSYVVSRPSQDVLSERAFRYLPARMAHFISRWYAILLSIYFYRISRWKPELAKQQILKMAQEQLGPDYDVATHFTPTYNPWDQRLCIVPDADLFTAIKAGTVSMVTDHIETFTETGIRLKSGQELTADIIVTATGLVMKLMSGVEFEVDGQRVDFSKTLAYKGMMFSSVPNLALAIGYTNASWTLKVDLTSAYVCRLINYMDRHGYRQCTPRNHEGSLAEMPLLDFTSGYVQRAINTLPRQGAKAPWKLYQNYLLDLLTLKYGRVNDGTMEFSTP